MYQAKVTSYHCNGSCDLAYDNGDVNSLWISTLWNGAMWTGIAKFTALINLLPNHQPPSVLLLPFQRFVIRHCIKQKDLPVT